MTFLPNRPRPFHIRHDRQSRVFAVHDGRERWLVNFPYWPHPIDGLPSETEAEQMAVELARLSKDQPKS